ncbi:uncharacterized protein N0V89_003748 [Didymosphaeria variabile]|uniref:Uncharacterized protein n=1 Tax=Didymosphaeria variabile TaxID=1932322 RepID=A0A9W8XQV5_9PLEO|nr:uncharacterized protein N0V89_003748 [Didymosphaeria variabile]KAJ4355728.1 hypothetical protein N0V89_003748 [Didymosphaeria variabile]
MSAPRPASHSTSDDAIALTASLSPKPVYLIRYDSLPCSDGPGHAQPPRGKNVGYTNDLDLVKLAERFKRSDLLRDKIWQVKKYEAGMRGQKRLKKMDDGPVEMKNGNWATFHGRYNAIMATRDWLAWQEKLYERMQGDTYGTRIDESVEEPQGDAVMESQQ